MPIYEFRCVKCNQIFELLKVNDGDDVEMRCPHCGSEDFERVLSVVSHTMGFGKGESRGPKVESRQCSSGTCTTYELPGHSRS
ncbi:MAG: zinc ribbon domain-containing protein [Deltaproteobacteria bacterium]|nr:zinc ribbon domain-containing protein [Deltaproteobacteria bacterium]